MNPIAVVAIGGNALAPPGERGTFAEQQAHARAACEGIAALVESGYRVVLTHGNGPQVGAALLRAEQARAELPAQPLDACVAETQGSIGYLLGQALEAALASHGLAVPVAAIVTKLVVDRGDPAFLHPVKPIGPFLSEADARERQSRLGWRVDEDSARGWRRLVASPRPLEILELPAIRACLDAGILVIAAGGGGIPVARRDGRLEGIEAVIDKDRASALLAKKLGAQLLLFSTDVDRVARHFGKPDQRWLDWLGWDEAWVYLAQGEFPPGSMGPKIEAALDFLRTPERRVLITSPRKMAAALRGRSGTLMQSRHWIASHARIA
ncbi:MAG TPA: carbamate kinase [Candidatus Acidoferrales bacterium]|nr:carbamate kinase [Candidatus Acidoferrales bacterium]